MYNYCQCVSDTSGIWCSQQKTCCALDMLDMTCCRSRDLLDIASPVRCIHVTHPFMFHCIILQEGSHHLSYMVTDKCCIWVSCQTGFSSSSKCLMLCMLFARLNFRLCRFSVVDGERGDL